MSSRRTTIQTPPNPVQDAASLVGLAARVGDARHTAEYQYDPKYRAALKATIMRDLWCSVLWAATNGEQVLEQPHRHGWKDFYVIQAAIGNAGNGYWQMLWDEKHPDRPGEAWTGEDYDLLPAWCDKMRTLIRECRQGDILDMEYDEYLAKLIDAGATTEEAEKSADWWLSVVEEEEGDTPSC